MQSVDQEIITVQKCHEVHACLMYISHPCAKKLGLEASGLSENRVKRKPDKTLPFVLR